ncbi:hypothetical protein [Maioricimonas sp. JC845]|uniref:hypothetical protein n=1 Tax=Maioricimonas sp. JC845 TaxID=3232138 RepID=UPI003458B5C5
MHVLGKVCLAFVVIGAIGAMILTSMLLDVRSHWMDQVESRHEQYVTQKEQLADARVAVSELEQEINRHMQAWGRSWSAVNSGVTNARNGEVTLGVGLASGLGSRAQIAGRPLESINIQLFAPQQDGSSLYLGDFKLKGLDANQALAQLNRAPLPGEAESWPAGTYRVRELVPPSWRGVLGELQTELTIAAQDLQEEEGRLQLQEQHLASSQELLQQRMHELEGDPNAPEDAEQSVVDGLVATLARLEDQRNQELQATNSLRRQLSDMIEALNRRLESNRAQVAQLPGGNRLPETVTGQVGAAAIESPAR